VGWRLGLSAAVLGITTALHWLLRLAAKRDSTPGAGVFSWDDAVLWTDWIMSASIAFAILALRSTNQLNVLQIAFLLIVLVITFAVLPAYMRWYGIDPVTNKPHRWRGIMASNVVALVALGLAVSAGVNLFQ
jgi:hypothetical protein